jgi:serine protease Do
MEELPRLVAAATVGSKAKVTVLREGKRRELDVPIERFPEEAQVAQAGEESEGHSEAFGVRVQDLTPALAEQLGVDETEGVVVTRVAPGSPAGEAGLRRGDVILEVDREAVKNVAQFEERLGSADRGALLLVRRGDNTVFMALQKPAEGGEQHPE